MKKFERHQKPGKKRQSFWCQGRRLLVPSTFEIQAMGKSMLRASKSPQKRKVPHIKLGSSLLFKVCSLTEGVGRDGNKGHAITPVWKRILRQNVVLVSPRLIVAHL